MGKIKYGYIRSPALVEAGRIVLTFRMILDCIRRQAPPTERLKKRTDAAEMDLDKEMAKDPEELSKAIREKRNSIRVRLSQSILISMTLPSLSTRT